ncbi:MAG: hypothetical protein ABL932_10325 [Terricaulis sp.]
MERVVTALAFILVGPPVGALWLWCGMLGLNLAYGEPNAYSTMLKSLPTLLAISYPAGFLPALLGAVVFVSLPMTWQRVVVALFIGAIATYLLWELITQIVGEGRGPPNPQGALLNKVLLITAGSAAAGVSVVVARFSTARLRRHFARDSQ